MQLPARRKANGSPPEFAQAPASQSAACTSGVSSHQWQILGRQFGKSKKTPNSQRRRLFTIFRDSHVWFWSFFNWSAFQLKGRWNVLGSCFGITDQRRNQTMWTVSNLRRTERMTSWSFLTVKDIIRYVVLKKRRLFFPNYRFLSPSFFQ